MSRGASRIMALMLIIAVVFTLGWLGLVHIPAESRAAVETGDLTRCWNIDCQLAVGDAAAARLRRGY